MMLKKLFFIIAIAFSVVSINAQDHSIKTDVLGPFLNNPFSIGYERNFGSANSMVFTLEGGWYMRDETTKDGQPFWDKKITGFGGQLEWRHYLRYRSNLSRPVGVFTGAYARSMQLNYSQEFTTAFNNQGFDDVTDATLAIGGGGIFGYKHKKPYSKFYFEALGGLGWGYAHLKEYQRDDLPDQYFLWRLELSVGYAF